jgi:hypothetical protein
LPGVICQGKRTLKENEELCLNNGLFIESDDDEEKELGRDEKDGNELNYSNDSNDNLEQRKVSSILAEKDKLCLSKFSFI